MTRSRLAWCAWIGAGAFCLCQIAVAGDQERHVVLVVWDGMRPDFVTRQNTPTLAGLGGTGVVFRNHHAVYLSATNVNGVALATGLYPDHSGVIANHEFRPRIDSRKPVDVENPGVVRRGDELTHGHYIAAPTVAELVRKAGRRTVIAGSKTVGLLHDRPNNVPFTNDSVTLSAGSIWPGDTVGSVTKLIGPFPASHIERDAWTTKALTDVFWKDSMPAFSVLWLGEPDLTQHETSVGAPAALRAMKTADDHLAAVLHALDQRHLRESTDVMVVSDHGFSTIDREIELPKILRDAGFDVATEFGSDPAAGEIMMVGGGGSVLFYVVNHESSAIQHLVAFLQTCDFTGVIFTREAMEGTFALNQALIDSADAPDVVMAFRWKDQVNQYGIRGLIDADWQRGAGKATHASLSHFDMHNTLIAAGPDFRCGISDDLPTGNADVAPTVLRLLNVPPPPKLDGRILTEALVTSSESPVKPETTTAEAVRQLPNGRWRQWLRTSRAGTTIYLDEGNGNYQSTGSSPR
jgi:arylsulfatase A-like enzyme